MSNDDSYGSWGNGGQDGQGGQNSQPSWGSSGSNPPPAQPSWGSTPPPGGGGGGQPPYGGGYGGQPPYGGGYNNPPQGNKPNTTVFLVLSIVETICCCGLGSLFGIAGIILSIIAGNDANAGNYEAANSKIKITAIILTIGFVLSLLLGVLSYALNWVNLGGSSSFSYSSY